MNTFVPDDQMEKYILQNSTEEPSLLRELAEETLRFTRNPRMMSGHVLGRLLAFVSKLLKPKRILEIGTFTGYSALCLCEGLPADGVLHTIEKNDEVIPIAQKYFRRSPFAERILLYAGDARNVVPALNETFQMVFLDGDKKEYPEYFALVSEKLASGGVLLCDNILWNGKVLQEPASGDYATRGIQELTRMIRSDNRYDNFILPVRDGLLIAIKI